MATQDISQLVVEVQSKGIQTAANQLDKLAAASDKAEAAVKKLGSVIVTTQGSTASAQAQAATSGINTATDAARKILSIAQRRDLELYNMSVAEGARIRAINERRDTEQWQAAVSQAEKIKAIQQKRDIEAWEEAVSQAAKIKAIQEKRDVDEYEEAIRQAAKIKAIQEKRDIELYEEKVKSAAQQKAIQEKRDMEEWTAAQEQSARIKAIQEKRDVEMHAMRVAAAGQQLADDERQRRMNASFQTASIASQIRTAREAQAYGALGGNATQRFGSAAATADINALVAAQERLARATRAASAAQTGQNAAMAEGHALARGLSGSLGALWVTYGNLAGMAVGIALGASLKGVITVGKDVEQTLEGIRVLGGASTSEMAKLSDTINTLGTGVSGPQEVAEALKTLTLAGLNATQAMAGVKAALNLAIGGEVSIEKSAETLVQVGSALGYSAASFDHISDVIVKTAAASMSSVDSISGAFKSAAAIGTTYGATLQDIAVGLAAVANLGIQGTAAGTALKNLYKDLSASTDKVTKTLKDMKLSITSFRDADGFMLPLVEVIQKLDAGMGTLDSKARNMAMVKLFGQQGLREGAALISLLHQAADDTERYGTKVDATHNKLVELQDSIRESAATAALAAIAMSQTTENQFKAVKNTLQTTFSQVFKDIQPQIGSIARALQSAFASDEFKNGLKTVISLLVDFTKVLFDNAAILRDVAMGIAGAKFLEMAGGIRAAVGAAATFTAALGPIAVAIAGLTFAWQMYKQQKDRALSNKDAEGNLEDYVAQVQKETAKQVELYNLRVKYGSDAAAQRAQEASERKEASKKAVDDAKAGLNKLLDERNIYWEKLTAGEKAKAQAIMALDEEGQKAALEKRKGIFTLGQTGLFDNLSHYVTATRNYADSQKNVAIQTERAKNAVEALNHVSGMNADWSDAEAKKNRIVSTGDGELSGKGGSDADAYAAAIAKYTTDIKAANQSLENARAEANEQFKAGQMGRLQLIDQVADKEIETANRVARDSVAAAKVAAAHLGKDGKADKTADVERFNAEAERANETAAQAEKMRVANRVTAEREAQAMLTSMRVKSLEEEGKFSEAAALKWGSDGKIILDQVTAEAERSGGVWLKLMWQFMDLQAATTASAKLKEDSIAFDTSLLKVESTLKGLGDATYGRSIGDTLDAAAEAAKKFEVALADAKKKRDVLQADADTSKSPEALKKVEEANKAILAAGDKMKSKFVEVGQSITSSLKDAFGSAGESLGKLNEAMLKYQNTENASAETRMKQYGDMAQAASGFFDKNSKGYRALNGIAQVFHIAEMARTVARTAAYVIEGAANMFGQSGWGGFAGVAAMGAVLAGLGWAASGASSHGADPKLDKEYVQKHQGTGSVLGDADAKSETITKLTDSLKSNSDMMLPLTSAMLQSLRNIEASMAGLAKLAVQNGVTDGSNFNVQTGTLGKTGSMAGGALVGAAAGFTAGSAMTLIGSIMGPLGAIAGALLGAAVSKLWGKTTQEISDSGLMFGGKVSDIQAGQGVDQYANVKTTKSSWFGLSKSSSNNMLTSDAGSEINDQFGKIFTGLQTSLELAATSLGTTGKAVGEAIDGVVLQTTKISLKDLKGDELTKAINSVISEAMDTIAKAAYPQMQAFQQVGEGYAQTVIRVASGIEQANVALQKLGVSALNYMDIANKTGDVAYEITKQSILMKEGASGVGDIMKNISGSISDITSAYTDLVAARKKMDDVGLGMGLSIDTLKGAGDLKTLTTSLGSFYDKYFTDTEKVAIETKNMTAQFAAAGAAIPKSREELRTWIEAAANAGDQLKVGKLLALAGGFDTLETAMEKLGVITDMFSDDAVAAAKEIYDNALGVAETALSRLETTINAEKGKIQTNVDALKNVLTTLGDAVKATAPKDSQINAFKKAMAVIDQAISTVNGGGDISGVSGLDDAIKAVSSQTDDGYGTLLDYQRAQAEANASLSSLEKAGNSQVDIYQKQLDKLDAQLDTAKAQLDALKGIDNSVMTVAVALANFGSALSAANVAKSNYTAVEAGNTGGGVAAAVESLYRNILHRASDQAGKSFWIDALTNKGASMAEVTKNFYDSEEFKSIPKFDVGTNSVPQDMLAMVHKGERIVPAADNAALEKRLKDADEAESKGASSAEANAKLDELIIAIQQGDVANVQKTAEMFKVIRDWNQNGMPPVRSDT
jgi:TP901 family phage tail tape measure protein